MLTVTKKRLNLQQEQSNLISFNMSNVITGVIEDITTRTAGDTPIITVVVKEQKDKYPQTLPIDFVGEKSALAETLKKGNQVTVHYNLRGNKSKNGQWFVSLSGWKIEDDF